VAAPIPFPPQSRTSRPNLRRREDCEVWVSILRRKPEVTGWAREPRARVRLVEVLVYLAIYGQKRPIPAGELRTQCWPPELAPTGPGEPKRLQEVTVDTFHQAMSRLRKQLGEGALGWHLPMAVHGAYVPGPGVGCDWTLFQALAALGAEAAARHETAKAIRLYREALELVEGEPFADVPPGSHVWVETEHLDTDIRLAVSQAASQLAEVAMHSDPETALWATQQGRLLLPTQLNLFDTWMMAAAELGDANGIDQALQAKTWAYGQLDPDGGVPPETMELYRHLMAKVNGRERVDQSGRS
ncbi:MAG TPA: bacterial transcriptional activator domain-containing protein, partial [Chloroflexota bacterium]|nr:bacterial transcriptional activator domain-containing protein [Chloroflexota bacterium]